jgi:hypothetical protein
MSRQRRTAIGGQFARTIEMLRLELADHGGTDNGKLPVTYQDFVQYGIERHAIAPALREVVVLGFIEITERGRAGNAEFRRPSLYRLTYRHTRSLPTDEWRRIKEDEAEVIARASRAASTSKTESQCGKTPKTVYDEAMVAAAMQAQGCDRATATALLDSMPASGNGQLARTWTRKAGARK